MTPAAPISVELRPIACPKTSRIGRRFTAAIIIGALEGPIRCVYGSEEFKDTATCEAHAIRVANSAARAFASAYGPRYDFTVTTQGTSKSE